VFCSGGNWKNVKIVVSLEAGKAFFVPSDLKLFNFESAKRFGMLQKLRVLEVGHIEGSSLIGKLKSPHFSSVHASAEQTEFLRR
jgi:hypothetical protein